MAVMRLFGNKPKTIVKDRVTKTFIFLAIAVITLEAETRSPKVITRHLTMSSLLYIYYSGMVFNLFGFVCIAYTRARTRSYLV